MSANPSNKMSAIGKIGKRSKPKKRKTKINLVFDEVERKEYLTGFRKRNLERRERAKAEFERKLKEERKRIQREAKDSIKKLIVSQRPIPELEAMFSNEFETEDATVKVVQLSVDDASEAGQWIGTNRAKEAESSASEESDDEEEQDELPGMEMVERKRKEETLNDAAKTDNVMRSKKEIKKLIKNQSTKKVKKSKTFQKKNRIERSKNKRNASEMKDKKVKSGKKKSQLKNKGPKNKNFKGHRKM